MEGCLPLLLSIKSTNVHHLGKMNELQVLTSTQLSLKNLTLVNKENHTHKNMYLITCSTLSLCLFK